MEILVINGSPKGNHSVTLQTVRYLEILHPEHHFSVLHAAQTIKTLEKNFTPAVSAIEKADVLLFSYPVYTFLAPSQLHRFLELLKQSGVELAGKYASQITTSKHFYDMTAHRCIQDNCADLRLRYIAGLSADMEDLTTKQGQKEADDFFRFLCWSVEHDIVEPPVAAAPAFSPAAVTVPQPVNTEKSGDVVIVADVGEEDAQLRKMIDRFRTVMPQKTRVVNIREYPFRGGCLGCLHCAVTGQCIYTDGFDAYLRSEIQTADAIVYAFTIRDHAMGARFKMYDDRQFCNGHRTVTTGRSVGYLISGNLEQEPNLRTVLEARAQVGRNYLAGMATDADNPDAAIDRLCTKLTYAIDNRYLPPQNFYGVGGMKIFRDLIWTMQGMMKADHRFYKTHGQYDFPQKQWPKMLAMYAVGTMLSSKKLQSKLGSAMTEGMLMPYHKVLEKAKKEQTAQPYFKE